MPNESSTPLLKTPLHSEHLKLGARMVPFAGYEMPVQYIGVLDETRAVRSAAGLFDVSHMGQFSVRGKRPLEAVQRLVTNDLSRLSMGQAQYNMLCNPEGGVIDDLVIYRRSEEETFICVNASNRARDFEWMRSHLGNEVTLEDKSDEIALIALQGPRAASLLAEGADAAAIADLKYYWARELSVFGAPCFLSRTGYTGEDGFELYLPRSRASEIWETLLEKGRPHGLVPAGLGARDTLRLEMGYPLHGHELSPTLTPLEANLNWVVKLDQAADFIGKEALRKQAAGGVPQKLCGFVIQDRRIARQGYPIVNRQHEPVGSVTSGTFSPHVNAPIAVGFVASRALGETELWVAVRDAFIPAVKAKLPFVPPHTKKSTP